MNKSDEDSDSEVVYTGLSWIVSIFLLYSFYENFERWKLGEDLYFIRSIVAEFSPGLALWMQGMLGFLALLIATYKTNKLIRNT